MDLKFLTELIDICDCSACISQCPIAKYARKEHANKRESLEKLLQEAKEIIIYGHYGGTNPQDFWDNYPIIKTRLWLDKFRNIYEKS